VLLINRIDPRRVLRLFQLYNTNFYLLLYQGTFITLLGLGAGSSGNMDQDIHCWGCPMFPMETPPWKPVSGLLMCV
jgi:hypothetical protein